MCKHSFLIHSLDKGSLRPIIQTFNSWLPYFWLFKHLNLYYFYIVYYKLCGNHKILLLSKFYFLHGCSLVEVCYLIRIGKERFSSLCLYLSLLSFFILKKRLLNFFLKKNLFYTLSYQTWYENYTLLIG